MSQVKERPILFSAPMVRAILEGRKTVTRRAVKGSGLNFLADFTPEYVALPENHFCPYGRPGDRLWVRETWARVGNSDPGYLTFGATYPACLPPELENIPGAGEIRWKPSIHMFRHDSRILLEITEVRVERLQDISEEQAQAEGCFFTDYGQACFHGGRGTRDAAECEYPASKHQQRPGWMWDKTPSHEHCLDSARNAFGNLWQSVGGNWNANPWVWVVEFKRVTP